MVSSACYTELATHLNQKLRYSEDILRLYLHNIQIITL